MKRKTKIKKYAVGSKVTNYIGNPNHELHKNAMALEQAHIAGMTDPLANILDGVGSMAISAGTKILGKGLTGEMGGLDGKGQSLSGLLGDKGMNSNLAGGIEGQLAGLLGNGGIQSLLGVSFAMGGEVPGIPIEAEGGEVVETPDGAMAELKGPNHENGGIDMLLPEGSEIFSKRLMGKDGKTMADRKKSREKQLSKLEKLLEKSPGDKNLKKTLDRTRTNFEKQEEEDMSIMESARQVMEMTNKMMYGGKAKYADGGIVFSKGFDQYGDLVSNALSTLGLSQDAQGLEQFQSDNGLKVDHIVGKNTYGLLSKVKNPIGTEGIQPENITSNLGIPGITNTSDEEMDLLNFEQDVEANLKAANSFAPYDQETNQILKDGKAIGTNGNMDWGSLLEGGIDNIGNILSGVGAYKAMTDPMKTLQSSLANSTENENHYANFGNDALAALENSRMNIEAVADNQKKDVQLSSRSAQNSLRNSARGINQMRAMDLATHANANKATRDIDNNKLSQLLNLDGRKAQLENVQDQMVMRGEATRDIANRQDMAAYYNNLMMLQSANAQNLQTLGKSFNNMKQDGAKIDLFGDIYKNTKYNKKTKKVEHNKK